MAENKALADVLLSVADAMLQMDARLKVFAESTSVRLSSIEQRLSLVEIQQQSPTTHSSGTEHQLQQPKQSTQQAHEVWKSRNEQGAPLQTAVPFSTRSMHEVPTTAAASGPDGSLEKAIAYFEARLRESRKTRNESQSATPNLSSDHTAAAAASSHPKDISREAPPCNRVQEWLSAASTLDVSDDSVQVGEYLNTMLKQRRAANN